MKILRFILIKLLRKALVAFKKIRYYFNLNKGLEPLAQSVPYFRRNNKVVGFFRLFLILFFIQIIALSQIGTIKVFGFEQPSEDTLRISKHQKIKNPVGNEFWLCFMRNYKDPDNANPSHELFLELFITGEQDANVNIEIDGIGYRTSVFVPKNTVKNVRIPSEAQVRSNQVIERLAVHITSDSPVSVYGLNRRFQTTDTYLAFPVEVLGMEYRVMCYHVSEGLMPEFSIVATENNTDVTIVPTFDTDRSLKGIPINIRLNRGDVYQVASKFIRGSNCDLTGSYIKANKKISVFAGHQCAYVPPTIIACNHLVEQMPPISSWGKHFYLGVLYPRNAYTFRVLANEAGTKIFVNSRLVRVLSAGQFFDSTLSREVQITSNKPILVAQFSHGYRYGDSIGDPMMLLVSPTQQFLKKYRFATPVNGFWRHMINVIVPTLGIKSMRLNGIPIDSSMFKTLGISRYSIAYIQVPFGTHSIEGDLPFGMYSYGFGYDRDAFDAYGTMAGQSFIAYEPAKDTLPPMADGKPNPDRLDVIVRDDREDDTGIRGISILRNEGFEIKMPEIDEGMPQAVIKFIPFDKNFSSRAVFVATDAASNESVWTVCYAPQPELNKFNYQLSSGIEENCKADPGFLVGVFGLLSYGLNSPSFSSTGNINSLGNFQSSSGLAGFFGVYLGRKLSERFGLSFRLTLQNFASEIKSPDTILGHIRIDTSLVTFQEGRRISLDGMFLNFGLSGDYFLPYGLYAFAGFDFNIPLSKSVSFSRYIIQPKDYQYSNGQTTLPIPIDKIESLSPFSFGLHLGFGYSYSFAPRFSFFAELLYNLPISSILKDGSWFYYSVPLHFGIRYRF